MSVNCIWTMTTFFYWEDGWRQNIFGIVQPKWKPTNLAKFAGLLAGSCEHGNEPPNSIRCAGVCVWTSRATLATKVGLCSIELVQLFSDTEFLSWFFRTVACGLVSLVRGYMVDIWLTTWWRKIARPASKQATCIIYIRNGILFQHHA
jgi:hypothetical protein